MAEACKIAASSIGSRSPSHIPDALLRFLACALIQDDAKEGAEDSAGEVVSNGISKNIMVIVFCALAFGANGGFLVYVFWVM